MPLTRQSIERQLQSANEDLEIRAAALKAKGVKADDFKRDPKWRHFDATCAQLRKRLRAVVAVEEREVACAERKAGSAAE